MAQLFEKVELRGEEDLLKIQQLLDEALDRRVQEAGDALTEQDREELRGTSAIFVEQLRQFVVFADEGGPCDTQRTQLTPPGASLAMKSPLLKPLSPPPADAEVQQLEAEVTAASLRVAELRTGMQSRLQGMLAAKLAACRPTAELEAEAAAGQPQGMEVAGGESEQARQQDGAGPAEGEQQQLRDGAGAASQAAEEPAAGQGEGGQQAEAMDSDGGEAPAAAQPAPAIPLSPQPQELQQRLLQAANRMPALRARLEQAADKLQRVVAAVAADINRPPPNTVERAVLGKTPGRPAEAAAAEVGAAEENEPGVSPLVKQALESGQISTRRRVARDVQPVPYNSQPE
ncbi:hypothetical protein CHLNCDRAFT_143020 [Chlorella variabilis]|uniref:Uncharacterized protein n=1 Tax=Chlorella variabilis TaxID=554065 RepID=E1Z9B3_CHLVA|nr:hypothetical protein CHLNCDRAFT_143020 [Chlorella variabilis]EFN57488.1 hypothetical protein CHLNCDRAFT_143020 [Chlorella variabilis]|eukprot:XP_005849590.1 hypothetical protein CHLNCDRAFT_143020 [Chlorella variabilis]